MPVPAAAGFEDRACSMNKVETVSKNMNLVRSLELSGVIYLLLRLNTLAYIAPCLPAHINSHLHPEFHSFEN